MYYVVNVDVVVVAFFKQLFFLWDPPASYNQQRWENNILNPLFAASYVDWFWTEDVYWESELHSAPCSLPLNILHFKANIMITRIFSLNEKHLDFLGKIFRQLCEFLKNAASHERYEFNCRVSGKLTSKLSRDWLVEHVADMPVSALSEWDRHPNIKDIFPLTSGRRDFRLCSIHFDFQMDPDEFSLINAPSRVQHAIWDLRVMIDIIGGNGPATGCYAEWNVI